MNILFVCKHNRFRSKVAEALFLHYNKRKDIEVKSAGVLLDITRPYVSKAVVELLHQRGIKIDEKSRQLDQMMIKWADKIILVADNVSFNYFPAEKIYAWPVADAYESDKASILITMNKIEEYVRNFVKRLNSLNAS